MDIAAAKVLAGSISSISIMGSGIGIGIVFGSLIEAVARNPEQRIQLFSYAMLGFALTESIALFGLLVTFLIFFIA